jgi:hypothetical protein
MQRNRHGIPVVPAALAPSECVNKKNHRPKLRFYSRFEAERYISEKIQPVVRREHFRVYACGDHFHLTTQQEGE